MARQESTQSGSNQSKRGSAALDCDTQSEIAAQGRKSTDQGGEEFGAQNQRQAAGGKGDQPSRSYSDSDASSGIDEDDDDDLSNQVLQGQGGGGQGQGANQDGNQGRNQSR